MNTRARSSINHLSCIEDATSDRAPLYVDEKELHRRVAPHLGEDRFRAAVRASELRGFPKVNALWRGRYWPAVKNWVGRR
jgi:hypothetical protein